MREGLLGRGNLEERTKLFPPIAAGDVQDQEMLALALEMSMDGGIMVPVGVQPRVHGSIAAGRIGMLPEHPLAHRPDAATAIIAETARYPGSLVTFGQNESSIRIQDVKLLPNAEIRIVGKG